MPKIIIYHYILYIEITRNCLQIIVWTNALININNNKTKRKDSNIILLIISYFTIGTSFLISEVVLFGWWQGGHLPLSDYKSK